ncbi:glycosyltransferase family 2 protein [Bacillus sp. B1-b2]|uniref:glycosyltransferase family 2 protein n=1 Tax=Bacillus sp. B1-b2 TaxID=2653201 RepID=UPI00126228FB|nr:glycosyltransferase family 2 protein [Bacillus sp. B1-b2]KAB7671700.1 glycosyltransferase family 2 protein [Bacillus sp. B1-b2]
MNVLNKRVSVIIPTYKREVKYILRAINSIKLQTHKNTEVVIVDDNPPDSEYRKHVMQFMQQFKDDDNVIYLMNPKNIGGSLARNKGINAATGEYITFLDDDDEYLPKKVAKQLEFMVEKDCDMSFTNLKLVNENKVVVDYRQYNSLKNFDNRNLLKYHLMRHLTGTPTFMYKAEKLKEIGGFEDARMGQEFYLMLKSIENNLKICYLNDCDVLAYRHNNGGISQGRNKIDGENTLYEFKKGYFHMLTRREKMFIRFRHYAVMVIAYKRNKNYFHALMSGIKMVLVSPVDFLSEVGKFFVNIFKNRRLEN